MVFFINFVIAVDIITASNPEIPPYILTVPEMVVVCIYTTPITSGCTNGFLFFPAVVMGYRTHIVVYPKMMKVAVSTTDSDFYNCDKIFRQIYGSVGINGKQYHFRHAIHIKPKFPKPRNTIL